MNIPAILPPMQSPSLLTGLSGYAVIRNAIRGDYPIIECAKSLLPVCNEVVIADCESKDGTLEMLVKFAATDPKIRVVSVPWPSLPTYDQWKADDKTRPPNNNHFWPQLLNVVRPMLRYQSQLHLDGDEILFPCAHEEILRAVASGECRYLRRINFWKDARHAAPDGWVCGTNVARLGPSTLWMTSDEHHPDCEPEIRRRATKHDSLIIGHYGFLRHQEGFLAKSRVMQLAVVGNFDPRLDQAALTGQNWWELSTFPAALVSYDGEHPEVIVPWLKERGRL